MIYQQDLKWQNEESGEGLGHYEGNIVSVGSESYNLPGVVVNAFTFCW
jgi:hypothetical protein